MINTKKDRRQRARVLAIAVAVACLASSALPGAPAAGASVTANVSVVPNGDPYVPPSETVETPSTDDCAQRTPTAAAGGHLGGRPTRRHRARLRCRCRPTRSAAAGSANAG